MEHQQTSDTRINNLPASCCCPDTLSDAGVEIDAHNQKVVGLNPGYSLSSLMCALIFVSSRVGWSLIIWQSLISILYVTFLNSSTSRRSRPADLFPC